MSRLTEAFPAERAALVVYLMAGYPDRSTSLAAARAAARAGADVIELGVPYGDPLADGPVIAAAGHAARSAPGGFGVRDALDLAAELTADPSMPPVVLMTYVNPMLRLGFLEFAALASDARVAGVIVPDLPPDGPVAVEWIAAARSAGLDTVFLVAPTSTDERVAQATAASTGFVYCVSSTGVTGERARLSGEAAEVVARVRAASGLPVALGFGVSTPEHAAEAARVADGVIVGTAVVSRQERPEAVAAHVASLAEAVAAARSS